MPVDWAAITDREVAAIEPEHADESCWCNPQVEHCEGGDVIVHHSLRSIVTGISDECWDAYGQRLS